MNIINRLNDLEEKAALLENKSDKNFSVMFKDSKGLYTYQVIDGEKVKIYPTQEELDEYQKNHRNPIITFDSCLDLR